MICLFCTNDSAAIKPTRKDGTISLFCTACFARGFFPSKMRMVFMSLSAKTNNLVKEHWDRLPSFDIANRIECLSKGNHVQAPCCLDKSHVMNVGLCNTRKRKTDLCFAKCDMCKFVFFFPSEYVYVLDVAGV